MLHTILIWHYFFQILYQQHNTIFTKEYGMSMYKLLVIIILPESDPDADSMDPLFRSTIMDTIKSLGVEEAYGRISSLINSTT